MQCRWKTKFVFKWKMRVKFEIILYNEIQYLAS